MSYENEVNLRLFRPILSGSEFNSLIPKSDCKTINAGVGNTSHSVNQMAFVAKKYASQMTKVAQKLKASSLKETVRNIQEFVYWHFQYKIDKADQFLRSPACSWKQRKKGIDCKSYSIIAASILHELGIKSYFRRVRFELNKPFSHVYNVIPKDQKTGNLNSGYYIIDGTLNIDIENEPYYYEKNDKKMETPNLEHFILAKPNLRGLGNTNTALSNYDKLYSIQRYKGSGLNAGVNGIFSEAKSFLDVLKFDNLGGLFNKIKDWVSKIGCLGGSAYNDGHLKRNMTTLRDMINSEIKSINNALADKNYAKMSQEIVDFYYKYVLFNEVVKSNLSEGWNSCSTKVQQRQIFITENHIFNISKALMAWANANFISTPNPNSKVYFHPGKSGGFLMGKGPKLEFVNSNASVTVTANAFDPMNPIYTGIKPNRTVTFFEATDEINQMFNSIENVKFDVNKFLNELQQTATVFYSHGVTPPSSNQSNIPSYTNVSSDSGSTIKKAGGGLLLLAALVVGATSFKL